MGNFLHDNSNPQPEILVENLLNEIGPFPERTVIVVGVVSRIHPEDILQVPLLNHCTFRDEIGDRSDHILIPQIRASFGGVSLKTRAMISILTNSMQDMTCGELSRGQTRTTNSKQIIP